MTSNLPLTLLAGFRIGVGAASFLLPGLTTTSLFYPLPAGSLFAVRAFGCRDLLLGALLWTAKSPEARRRAVLAGAAVDALDAVACIWGIAEGNMEGKAALAFGGGAVSFLTLAGLGWRAGGLGAVAKIGGVAKSL